MAYDMKNARQNLGDIANVLQAEHPCNARQMGFLLISGLELAHKEIERLKQEIQDVTVAALDVVLDAANTPGVVQHSGKDKWHDYEVPILHDPVLGIPHGVRVLRDNNNDVYVRVGTQDRWHDVDAHPDDLKTDGYLTVEDILSDYSRWVRIEHDDYRHTLVAFDKTDEQPDPESFPVLRTRGLDLELFFHWSHEDGKFHCMNNDQPSQEFCENEFGTQTPNWATLVRKTILEEVPQ